MNFIVLLQSAESRETLENIFRDENASALTLLAQDADKQA
jgi:hypothetical protein